MGKIVQESDEAMSVEEAPQQLQKGKLAKKNKAIKKITRQSKQAKESGVVSQAKRKKKSPSIVSKIARRVNLAKSELGLDQKQDIFKNVVSMVTNNQRIHRKDRKKHRYLVKKQLRKQIDERLPVKQNTAHSQEKIDEEQRAPLKKQKFEKEKAIQQFKSTMGVNFASIKQKLAQKVAFQSKG